jgi:hypothetical protein
VSAAGASVSLEPPPHAAMERIIAPAREMLAKYLIDFFMTFLLFLLIVL